MKLFRFKRNNVDEFDRNESGMEQFKGELFDINIEELNSLSRIPDLIDATTMLI